ncbi:MAG TPA: filamentous hemagglutinin N-terminal domain-containing protein, partial [Burkholderiales bacterium]|nr:filamentous hemagglutinin N-terminal domain-containing protein [Burkholderiales bacterium]
MLRATSDAGRPFQRKLLCALVLSLCVPAAKANPVGPQVVNGQVSIAQQGTTLNITNSPGAIINWQGFSIAAGETTRFIQQSSTSAVLNRVVGPDPSVLLGTLTSNGRVFLINPSGILVGEGARIDVPGLVASTLNISNQDFLAGRLNFQANAAAGAVENRGTITTPTGGSVYLVGSGVNNSGIITSPQGDVILAAGQSVKILDTSTPGVRVEITASDNAVVNLGQIVAKSGQIGIYAATLRNGGVINADQVVRGEDGRIFLKASKDVTLDAGSSISASGDSGGSVTVQAEQGTLLASGSVAATGADGKGGDIKLLGHFVGLTEHATVDASGSAGGGTVLVGGDAHGANAAVQNASATYIGPDATIKADATVNGDGGKVVVWSDDVTRFYGNISARGGARGGNGGFVETSSHNVLDAGGSVDAGATAGTAGRWLLDPFNLTISNNANAGVNATTATFDAIATGANVQAAQIQSALNGGTSVTVTTGTSGAEAGNITVSGSADAGGAVTINKTTGAAASLTLQAAGNIDIHSGATIESTAAGNALDLALNAGGATTISGATIALNGGTLSAGAGGITIGANTTSVFSALTLNADVTVPNNTLLDVVNGLTLANGHRITLASTGNVSQLDFIGASQTLGGSGEVIFGGTSTADSLNSNLNANQTLTIGTQVTVHSGAGGQSGTVGVSSGTTIANQGTISSDAGKTVAINGNGTLSNSGTLSATGAGSVLTIAPTNWNNTGTLLASGGGTLNLEGTFTTASLAGLNGAGGTVVITQGTLDNTGATFAPTATTGNVQLGQNGRILNGTIGSAGAQLVLAAGATGTFDGVTLNADVTVPNNTLLDVVNGLTLANGHRITLASTGNVSQLDFIG